LSPLRLIYDKGSFPKRTVDAVNKQLELNLRWRGRKLLSRKLSLAKENLSIEKRVHSAADVAGFLLGFLQKQLAS
jgi:hypothetical protein